MHIKKNRGEILSRNSCIVFLTPFFFSIHFSYKGLNQILRDSQILGQMEERYK